MSLIQYDQIVADAGRDTRSQERGQQEVSASRTDYATADRDLSRDARSHSAGSHRAGSHSAGSHSAGSRTSSASSSRTAASGAEGEGGYSDLFDSYRPTTNMAAGRRRTTGRRHSDQ